MIIGVRKMAVWATTAAAIVSAVMLALSDGGLPRFDAPARSGSVRAAPATPAH
jgi:hypothetical protein